RLKGRVSIQIGELEIVLAADSEEEPRLPAAEQPAFLEERVVLKSAGKTAPFLRLVDPHPRLDADQLVGQVRFLEVIGDVDAMFLLRVAVEQQSFRLVLVECDRANDGPFEYSHQRREPVF